jgi:hypothetical protein
MGIFLFSVIAGYIVGALIFNYASKPKHDELQRAVDLVITLVLLYILYHVINLILSDNPDILYDLKKPKTIHIALGLLFGLMLRILVLEYPAHARRTQAAAKRPARQDQRNGTGESPDPVGSWLSSRRALLGISLSFLF